MFTTIEDFLHSLQESSENYFINKFIQENNIKQNKQGYYQFREIDLQRLIKQFKEK